MAIPGLPKISSSYVLIRGEIVQHSGYLYGQTPCSQEEFLRVDRFYKNLTPLPKTKRIHRYIFYSGRSEFPEQALLVKEIIEPSLFSRPPSI